MYLLYHTIIRIDNVPTPITDNVELENAKLAILYGGDVFKRPIKGGDIQRIDGIIYGLHQKIFMYLCVTLLHINKKQINMMLKIRYKNG